MVHPVSQKMNGNLCRLCEWSLEQKKREDEYIRKDPIQCVEKDNEHNLKMTKMIKMKIKRPTTDQDSDEEGFGRS